MASSAIDLLQAAFGALQVNVGNGEPKDAKNTEETPPKRAKGPPGDGPPGDGPSEEGEDYAYWRDQEERARFMEDQRKRKEALQRFRARKQNEGIDRDSRRGRRRIKRDEVKRNLPSRNLMLTSPSEDREEPAQELELEIPNVNTIALFRILYDIPQDVDYSDFYTIENAIQDHVITDFFDENKQNFRELFLKIHGNNEPKIVAINDYFDNNENKFGTLMDLRHSYMKKDNAAFTLELVEYYKLYTKNIDVMGTGLHTLLEQFLRNENIRHSLDEVYGFNYPGINFYRIHQFLPCVCEDILNYGYTRVKLFYKQIYANENTKEFLKLYYENNFDAYSLFRIPLAVSKLDMIDVCSRLDSSLGRWVSEFVPITGESFNYSPRVFILDRLGHAIQLIKKDTTSFKNFIDELFVTATIIKDSRKENELTYDENFKTQIKEKIQYRTFTIHLTQVAILLRYCRIQKQQESPEQDFLSYSKMLIFRADLLPYFISRDFQSMFQLDVPIYAQFVISIPRSLRTFTKLTKGAQDKAIREDRMKKKMDAFLSFLTRIAATEGAITNSSVVRPLALTRENVDLRSLMPGPRQQLAMLKDGTLDPADLPRNYLEFVKLQQIDPINKLLYAMVFAASVMKEFDLPDYKDPDGNFNLTLAYKKIYSDPEKAFKILVPFLSMQVIYVVPEFIVNDYTDNEYVFYSTRMSSFLLNFTQACDEVKPGIDADSLLKKAKKKFMTMLFLGEIDSQRLSYPPITTFIEGSELDVFTARDQILENLGLQMSQMIGLFDSAKTRIYNIHDKLDSLYEYSVMEEEEEEKDMYPFIYGTGFSLPPSLNPNQRRVFSSTRQIFPHLSFLNEYEDYSHLNLARTATYKIITETTEKDEFMSYTRPNDIDFSTENYWTEELTMVGNGDFEVVYKNIDKLDTGYFFSWSRVVIEKSFQITVHVYDENFEKKIMGFGITKQYITKEILLSLIQEELPQLSMLNFENAVVTNDQGMMYLSDYGDTDIFEELHIEILAGKLQHDIIGGKITGQVDWLVRKDNSSGLIPLTYKQIIDSVNERQIFGQNSGQIILKSIEYYTIPDSDTGAVQNKLPSMEEIELDSPFEPGKIVVDFIFLVRINVYDRKLAKKTVEINTGNNSITKEQLADHIRAAMSDLPDKKFNERTTVVQNTEHLMAMSNYGSEIMFGQGVLEVYAGYIQHNIYVNKMRQRPPVQWVLRKEDNPSELIRLNFEQIIEECKDPELEILDEDENVSQIKIGYNRILVEDREDYPIEPVNIYLRVKRVGQSDMSHYISSFFQ